MKNQGTVAIGYCYGSRTEDFHDSMELLKQFDREHNNLFCARVKAQGIYIEENRNQVVRQMLTTEASWLLMVDTDIKFKPEMAYALYDIADPVTRPMVSGIYFSRLKQARLVPIWFMEHGSRYTSVQRIEGDGGQPQALDAVGMGFVIMHRSIFNKLHEIHGKDHWTWFSRDEVLDPDDGTMHHLGEDLSFCRRVKRAGFPIYGHAGVQVGHGKPSMETYEQWLKEEHPEQLDKYEFDDGVIVAIKDSAA